MNKILKLASLSAVAGLVLAACGGAAPTPQVIRETVVVEKPVEKVVEKVSTQVVQATVIVQATAVPPTAVPKPVEVTFWHAYGTGSSEELAMGTLVRQAAKDMPNVKINLLQVPFDQIFNKYRTEVAAGGGPNMFIAPNDDLGNDARAKLIADITELAKGKLDGYAKLSVDGMSLDGKLYGIPESLKAVAMYYNKDLIKEVPKTTDDMAKAIAGGAKIGLSLGCYHNFGFFNGFGAKIFDDKYNFINTPENAQAIADTMTFLNTSWQAAKKAGVGKGDQDGGVQLREGKIGALFNGNWALADYQKALGDKLGVAPLPAGPKGPSTPLLGVDGFYFNPNNKADQAAAALQVALYLTNANSQQLMAEFAGHVPARTDVKYNNALVKAFQDSFAQAYVRPQVENMGKYWGNFCGTDDIYEKGVKPLDWATKGLAGAVK